MRAGMFTTPLLAALMCLAAPPIGLADAAAGEQVGRQSVDLFFETLVPLLDRASRTELRHVMGERGLRCRVRKRGTRVDCPVNGRTRFLGRFESEVMWAVLLVSVQKGACPAILERAQELIGEPSSIEEGWHRWSAEGQSHVTAFRDKVGCQLLRAPEADEEE